MTESTSCDSFWAAALAFAQIREYIIALLSVPVSGGCSLFLQECKWTLESSHSLAICVILRNALGMICVATVTT